MNPIYIVVWCTLKGSSKVDTKMEDQYETCESLEAAQRKYAALLTEASLYSANICAVVASTDYDTHPLLEGLK